jgi:hypothetical protein
MQESRFHPGDGKRLCVYAFLANENVKLYQEMFLGNSLTPCAGKFNPPP